jgi:hypothetical protein
MARLSPRQVRVRRRVEDVLRLLEPALDLLLATGDRVSRLAASDRVEDWSTRPLSGDASRRVTRLAR